MEKFVGWVEAHPYEATAIGAGGLIVVMWWLGFFSSSSNSSSGSDPLAAAYYSAEAAQTQSAAQVQLGQDQLTAATSIANIQAQADEALAVTAANMQTTINGQNVGRDTAIANLDLLATENNNQTAIATNQSNNDMAISVTGIAAQAQEMLALYNTTLPTEIKQAKGKAVTITDPTGKTITAGRPGPLTPKAAKAAGYTPRQFAKLTGLPKPTPAQWAAL